MAEPYFTTLAARALAGDDRIVLCSRAGAIHHVTIGAGTPREQKVRVWGCYGIGPYFAFLGYDKDHPVYLDHSHMAGSIVRIEGVSAALAAARLKAAFGPCAHPEAVAVDTLDGETVAWLCPACDEQLPVDWAPSALPQFIPDPTLEGTPWK